MLESINLDTVLHILNDIDRGCQDDGVRPSKDWVRNHLDKHSERHLTAGITGTRVSLDKNTLKWRSWSSTGTSSVPSEGVQNENSFDQPFYKLTSKDFRKLNNQVRDTSSAPLIRKSSTNFKAYHTSRSGDSTSKLYRSQLSSSLKTFNDRKWQSYENETDNVTSSRSRPGSSLSDTRLVRSRPSSSRLSFATPPPRSRPQSSPSRRPSSPPDPQESLRVQSVTISKQSSYDSLTPEVVYALSSGPKPESVYGDRSESALGRLTELEEEPKESTSDASSEHGKIGTPNAVAKLDGLSACNKHIGSADDLSDRDTDIDSDEEDYPEPPVEEVNLNQLPNLSLRPEKMDALDIPVYARGDRRKYDFDATVVDYPACEFPYPLPECTESLNFAELCLSEKNWREQTTVRPEIPEEEYIIDRLIEFERLQAKTKEWESAKQDRIKATRQRQNKSKVYPTSRVQSAKTWREKTCCLDCMQQACVGDCPGKPPSNSTACPVCHEKQCAGNCSQSVYESRSRSDWEEEKPKLRPPPRPKSCNSCQQRHTAKMINSNNLLLGRPKSGHATFSRGQNSFKPKDMRPKSGNELPKDLQNEFESMGLDQTAPDEDTSGDPVSRPGTAGSVRRRAGRAGVLPGKSYFSQRRISLTDPQLQTAKVKTTGIRRVKSGRRRRPNTAT